jgi:hypothetical protein
MKILTELSQKFSKKSIVPIFFKRIQPVGLEISKITSLNGNKFFSSCEVTEKFSQNLKNRNLS